MKSIAVRLKSGELYNFYNIKQVKIIDSDTIVILGSIKPPNPVSRSKYYRTSVGKAKTITVKNQMIANIREFSKFLKENFKYFDFEGVCPICKSTDIQETGIKKYKRKINKWKEDIEYTESIKDENYFCLHCKKQFKELYPCDIMVYY